MTRVLDRDVETAVKWLGPTYSKVHGFGSGKHKPTRVVGVFAPTTSAVLRRIRRRREMSEFWCGRPGDAAGSPVPKVLVVNAERLQKAGETSRFVATGKGTVTCQVETVAENSFTAIYYDKDNGFRRVRFPTANVTNDERHLIEPRAEFHWSIGKEERGDGVCSTISRLRFVRNPVITGAMWEAALDEGAETAARLGITLA